MPEEASRSLLAWFDRHKRDLPWRRSRDPYTIWVSEIMLQQTRVAAVLEHYARWMQQFPSVVALARAAEPEVLAAWSGLGYYRRARMLHRAAQMVANELGGVVPRTAAELLKLPGIGAYTAAAIASIAFGEAIAVVDGNVERVLTRLLALASPSRNALPHAPARIGAPKERGAAQLARAIRDGAQALLVPGRPGDSNQAMMELGATVCLPKVPLCLHCPVQPWCGTRGEHSNAPRKPQQTRDIAYALVERATPQAAVLLCQRPAGSSLMAGMWELPEVTADTPQTEVVLRLRHAITVTNYGVTIMRRTANSIERDDRELRWIAIKDMPSTALTGLARKALRKLGLWPQATEAPAALPASSNGRQH